MIQDINIDNRKIYISYTDSRIPMFPSNNIFPSDNLFLASTKEITTIVQGSITLNEMIVDSELKFGNLYASKFEVEVYDIDDISGKFIQVYQEENNIFHGIFSGQIISCTLDNTGINRKIVAYDQSYIIRDTNVADWWTNYWTNRTSSTLGDLRINLLDYMSIQSEDVQLINDDITITKTIDMTYISFGDVLSKICELNACFPHFSRDNQLEYIMLDPESDAIDITGKYEGLESQFEDFVTDAITGIQFFDSENDLRYTYGTLDNTYKMSVNFLLYDMSTSQLNSIAETIMYNIENIQYTPANVKMIVGSLDYELGDKIHTPKGDFYIFENEYSSSQLVEETMICKGEQRQSEDTRNVGNSNIILKQKISRVELDVESLSTEFADFEADTESKFEQTAEQITVEVAKGTANLKATYSGDYVPTSSNYPANEWTTILEKEKNVGATFYSNTEERTYRWVKSYNAIKITFDSTSELEDSGQGYDYLYIYCNVNGTMKRTNKITGNIANTSIVIPTGSFYVYFYTDVNVQKDGFGISGIERVISDNPNINMVVTESLPSMSVTQWPSGISTLLHSDRPYSSNMRILWSWDTQLVVSTNGGYKWELQEAYAYSQITQTATQLQSQITQTASNLQSQITQTANQVNLKVSKGDVTSELNLESSAIRLNTAGRLIITAGNFKLDEYGNLTASNANLNGSMTSSTTVTSGGSSYTRSVVIDSGGLVAKYNNSNVLELSATTMSIAGPIASLESNFPFYLSSNDELAISGENVSISTDNDKNISLVSYELTDPDVASGPGARIEIGYNSDHENWRSVYVYGKENIKLETRYSDITLSPGRSLKIGNNIGYSGTINGCRFYNGICIGTG